MLKNYEHSTSARTDVSGYPPATQSSGNRGLLPLLAASLYGRPPSNAGSPYQREEVGTISHRLGVAVRRGGQHSKPGPPCDSILLQVRSFVLEQPLANVDALRATRPVHERYAPTVTETQTLLQTIPNQGGYPTNLVARLLYGCGLRVSEPLNLRIKDVDLERRRLCIRGAKGGNDRVINLPQSLIRKLRQQMQLARTV